jgi:hypothetical protein
MIITYQDTPTTYRHLLKPALITTGVVLTLSTSLFALSQLVDSSTPLLSPTTPEFEASLMQVSTPATLATPVSPSDTQATPSAVTGTITKQIIIPAGSQEVTITDPDLTDNHNVVLSPMSGDTSIYYLKSRSSTSFTVKSLNLTETDRALDYSLVTL